MPFICWHCPANGRRHNNLPNNRMLLLFTMFFLLSPLVLVSSTSIGSKWRDTREPGGGAYEPPLAMEVPSPLRYRAHFFVDAYRLHCHSCMSPYLEDQFQYISHLYRRPMVFTDKCDHGQFDGRYVRTKNCTDACVTLRMNDRVGGRRRFGFMRGCLSDIIHHNRTAVRFGELSRTTKSGASICTAIRLRDLFVSSDKYGFDPHDHVDLCACIRPNCNSASQTGPSYSLLFGLLALLSLLRLQSDWRTTPNGEKMPEVPGILVEQLEDLDSKEEKHSGSAKKKRKRRKGKVAVLEQVE